ncbi:MAG: TIM barrel protein [Planctomycetes bacterium]|jgi:sugar phosphate isomerase/epimerase|nr:TIM barrel protein [Planctomycetota bacterium]
MPWTLSAFADEAGDSTDEQLQALAEGGLKLIDPRNVDGHNIAGLPLDHAEQVARRYEAAGIRVNMFGSPIGKIDIADDVQTDLDKLEHLGKLKQIFGCDGVRMFSYFNKAGAPRDQWRDQALDNLRRLRDKAGQLGLVLYHENESDIFGDHSDHVLEIAELRDGKTFRLIYDFANYIRTGEAGWDTWQKLRDQTDYFHFKDQKKTGEHTPMGEGDTDARRILEDAAKAGWEGGCTLEPHLKFSKAVLATHASGTGSQALADLNEKQLMQVAIERAKAVLDGLSIAYT